MANRQTDIQLVKYVSLEYIHFVHSVNHERNVVRSALTLCLLDKGVWNNTCFILSVKRVIHSFVLVSNYVSQGKINCCALFECHNKFGGKKYFLCILHHVQQHNSNGAALSFNS